MRPLVLVFLLYCLVVSTLAVAGPVPQGRAGLVHAVRGALGEAFRFAFASPSL